MYHNEEFDYITIRVHQIAMQKLNHNISNHLGLHFVRTHIKMTFAKFWGNSLRFRGGTQHVKNMKMGLFSYILNFFHWYFLQDMHILVLLETKHWNQSPKWHQRTISKIVCFIMAPPMGKSWCAVPPLEHHVSQKYFAFIVFAWMVTLWAPRQINMLELCILMHPNARAFKDPRFEWWQRIKRVAVKGRNWQNFGIISNKKKRTTWCSVFTAKRIWHIITKLFNHWSQRFVSFVISFLCIILTEK